MAAPLPDSTSVLEAVPREAGRPRAEPGPSATEIDDRLVRAIGIPAFGLSIPHLTGLFDGVGAGEAAFWIGTAWFVALSAAIWHGNRWLLLEQRRHWNWFGHPVRKIVMLLAAIVLFTAPLTVTMLAGWYAWRGAPVAWPVVQTVVLVNVICVVFVTHVYETVFLIKEREDDRVRVLELDRARARAELAAFLAQVDPHFLFNSLTTLGHLISTDPPRAAEFNRHLATLQRYLLAQRGRELVPLAEELAFVEEYVSLMKIRFGDALVVDMVDDGVDRAALLPPVALQSLVENAIKHNEVGEGRPLAIRVVLRENEIIVENESRPRRSARVSAGIGLQNLDERIRLSIGKRITIYERDGRFVVTLPLDQVAYVVVEDRLSEVVARDGRRLVLDRPLAELEAELAPAEFFRVNRQYLVAASAVRGFKPFVKGKLIVELEPAPAGDVIVSQENAARFKAWLAS